MSSYREPRGVPKHLDQWPIKYCIYVQFIVLRNIPMLHIPLDAWLGFIPLSLVKVLDMFFMSLNHIPRSSLHSSRTCFLWFGMWYRMAKIMTSGHERWQSVLEPWFSCCTDIVIMYARPNIYNQLPTYSCCTDIVIMYTRPKTHCQLIPTY